MVALTLVRPFFKRLINYLLNYYITMPYKLNVPENAAPSSVLKRLS